MKFVSKNGDLIQFILCEPNELIDTVWYKILSEPNCGRGPFFIGRILDPQSINPIIDIQVGLNLTEQIVSFIRENQEQFTKLEC